MSMEHLSDQQIARVEALHAGREVGRKIPSAFGGATPPDVPELVDLAEYILHGIHPMDRYYEDQQAKEVKTDGDEADAGESAETPAGG
jgi:hypothetical protein